MLAKLLSYLFPVECLECYELWSYLCSDCKQKLRSHADACPYCHRPQECWQRCLDCGLDKSNVVDGIIIWFGYDELVKKLILQLKYYHKADIAHFFAQQLAWMIRSHQLMQEWNSNNTIISFVPSRRRRRLWIKWYNQSQLLAEELAQQLGWSCLGLVEKIKKTKRQASLSRADRLINLAWAFAYKHDVLIGKNIQHVILVDDVTTTASTLTEVAMAIKKHYPELCVWAVVVARHG